MLQTLARLRRRLRARRLRLGPPIAQVSFMGCQMLVRPHEDVGRNMALGEFETDDLRHFLAAVRDGDIVFDIGANTGAYCVPTGRSHPRAQVHAFEPIDLNASLVQVSLHLSAVDNVRVVRKCVSDKPGRVAFSLAADSAYSSMIDTGRKVELQSFECDAVTLADYCRAAGDLRPDVLKVDVEGAELKVLQGADALFDDPVHRPRLVLIELYNQNLRAFGTSIDEVCAWIVGRGYHAYVLVDGAPVAFAPEHHDRLYNVFFAPLSA
jgi:FkbM family methyltransferase